MSREMSVDFRRLSKLAKNFKSQAVNLSWKKKEISKFCIKNISKWMCKELAKRVAVQKNRAEARIQSNSKSMALCLG